VTKTVISTSEAPQAIGPYSQAVSFGDFVFCSGQVALDPATGELVGDGVGEQARRCMENLRAVLAAAGTNLDRIVKTTIFLTERGLWELLQLRPPRTGDRCGRRAAQRRTRRDRVSSCPLSERL
jgi:enamine deaminase RidA (YjgF/YER057c/UK114 family)